MRNRKGFLAGLLLLTVAGVAGAAEGQLDRSADVARYVSIMQTGSVGDAAHAAKKIYTSGISDPALAEAINARILAEDRTLGSQKDYKEFAVFMVRALASAGNVGYAGALTNLQKQSRNSKLRSAIEDELPQLQWYHDKNAATADATGHASDEDPDLAGLANLLVSNNMSFKHWAAERMYWDRVFDASLMQMIAPQLRQFVDQGRRVGDPVEDDTMSLFIRLIGFSKNAQYQELLAKVMTAPTASAKMKKYSQGALEILRRDTI